MTRRLWKTEDGWDVATGYDRIGDKFFIDISKDCWDCAGVGEVADEAEVDTTPCKKCGGEGIVYLYNNLDAKEFTDRLGGQTLVQVGEVVDKYLTVRPPLVFDILLQDKIHQVVNEIEHYGTWGRSKG